MYNCWTNNKKPYRMEKRKETKFEDIDPHEIHLFEQKKDEKVHPFQKNAMSVALLELSQLSTVRTIFKDDLEQSFESKFKRRNVFEGEFDKVLQWFQKNGYVVSFEVSLTVTQKFHDLMDKNFGFIKFENPLPKPGEE